VASDDASIRSSGDDDACSALIGSKTLVGLDRAVWQERRWIYTGRAVDLGGFDNGQTFGEPVADSVDGCEQITIVDAPPLVARKHTPRGWRG
jgi:hypothetical protein